MSSKQPSKSSNQVTQARAAAQRAKLDAQSEARRSSSTNQETTTPKKAKGKKDQKQLLANRRATTTIERAIEDYLADHEGGNHSNKTTPCRVLCKAQPSSKG